MPALMLKVAEFADQQKLLGHDGRGLDTLGIAFSGERTLGNSANILLRFDDRFMQMAAEQRL